MNSLRHLAWPWSSPELREQHGGVPSFVKKVDGEAAGEEGSSLARRTEAEKARIGGTACDSYCPGARFRLRVRK